LTREQREAAERLDTVRATLHEATAVRDDAQEAVERKGPEWTRMVELRESALALDGERRVAERDVGEARREFERLDRELAEALSARAELEALAPTLAEAPPLREELDRLDRQAQEAGRRRSLLGQLRELDEQEARVRKRLAQMEHLPQQLEDAKRALEAARQALKEAERAEDEARTTWVRDRQDAETKRQSLREQYADHKRHRESVLEAGADGECPVCKRPLGDVYREALETLANQMEEIEVKGKFFKQRVEQLQAPPAEVRRAEERTAHAADVVEQAVQRLTQTEAGERERDHVVREIARIAERRGELQAVVQELPETYDADRHDEVRRRLRGLEPTVAQAAGLEGKARHAESLVEQAEQAERELSERETRVKALEASIADLGYDEERYATARADYQAAEAAAREAELRVVSVQGDVRAAEAAHEAAVRRLREREAAAAKIADMKKEIAVHDELDRAFHQLRQELNTQMRPELSERASAFLASLTDDRYHELELDEDYRLLVIEEGQAKQVISGGEEDITHLVLRLAISQMVAERAGQPLSLLVLDEIFGSLDEHRRHNVVALLRALADRFPQVVLITHIETVREGVDRVLRVALDTRRGAAEVTEGGIPGGDGVAA
jgi:exonuclease SbcC